MNIYLYTVLCFSLLRIFNLKTVKHSVLFQLTLIFYIQLLYWAAGECSKRKVIVVSLCVFFI